MLVFALAESPPPLSELVKRSYLELVELSPNLHYPKTSIDDYRRQLETSKKEELDGLDAEKKQLRSQEDDARRQLDDLNRSASTDDASMAGRRTALHCLIFKIETDLSEGKNERSISIPIEYDHRITKLEIVSQWPAKKKEIDQAVASGKARARKWGDVDDIGYRKIGENQEADIKLGEEAVNELRAYRLLPPESDSKPLHDYVQELADRLAAVSDLKVPLRIGILDTSEINAFGLPGGRLFVNIGLIVRAANESELAGVLTHEIAHIAARHGEKLTRPTGNLPRMLLQGATMAADAFTGGAVGTAKSAAHDVLGLGVHLNLGLIGVSRETEAEAGQLGTQYLWRAGYDPRGFMRFYDKMVAESVRPVTASFFRTHPPSTDRALISLAELEYLPKKPHPRTDSPAFQRARAIADQWLKARAAERKRTGLTPPPECAH